MIPRPSSNECTRSFSKNSVSVLNTLDLSMDSIRVSRSVRLIGCPASPSAFRTSILFAVGRIPLASSRSSVSFVCMSRLSLCRRQNLGASAVYRPPNSAKIAILSDSYSDFVREAIPSEQTRSEDTGLVWVFCLYDADILIHEF